MQGRCRGWSQAWTGRKAPSRARGESGRKEMGMERQMGRCFVLERGVKDVIKTPRLRRVSLADRITQESTILGGGQEA